METQPTPLAGRLAGLRAAITSNDDRGWLPASLHALIMAIFARIFGRLEHILQLWQAGQLPLPPARPQSRHTSHHNAQNVTRQSEWDQRANGPSRESVLRTTPPEARLLDPSPTPSPASIAAARPMPSPSSPHRRPNPTHDPPSAKKAAQAA